jgi:hypothetical protein
MALTRLGLLALLLFALVGCEGGAAGSDEEPLTDPPPSPAPPPATGGTTTSFATVPNSATPPVGVTLHVGFTENVTRARMESMHATWTAASNALWNASEGQVRIDAIVYTENHAPGLATSQFMFGFGSADTSTLDVLVWTSLWDVPASGAVTAQPGMGRQNRLMVVPASADVFTLLHECSHLVFRLTWAAGPMLADEYSDGQQDAACIMEGPNQPWRWCSDANHVNQSSQPHSCWRQILLDYPNFSHSGADTASAPPAAPTAVYNDAP